MINPTPDQSPQGLGGVGSTLLVALGSFLSGAGVWLKMRARKEESPDAKSEADLADAEPTARISARAYLDLKREISSRFQSLEQSVNHGRDDHAELRAEFAVIKLSLDRVNRELLGEISALKAELASARETMSYISQSLAAQSASLRYLQQHFHEMSTAAGAGE